MTETTARKPIRASRPARDARILGIGGYRPARLVPNAEIVERIDSSDEWIRTRSGIASRRWANDEETVVAMSVAASGKALAHAGLTPDQIGCVVVSTVTHLYQTPSAAAEIAYKLGTDRAAAFDISAACAGFCYGLSLGADMVRGGSAEHVLVIGVERLSDLTDQTDRSTAFIFADGAGAAVIGPSTSRRSGRSSGARTASTSTSSGSARSGARQCSRPRARAFRTWSCRETRSSAGRRSRWPRWRERRSRLRASLLPTSTCSYRIKPTCASPTPWPAR